MSIARRPNPANVGAHRIANQFSRATCVDAGLQLFFVQSEAMHSRDTLRLDKLKIGNYQRNSCTHCGETCAEFIFGLSAIAVPVTALQQLEHSNCTDQGSTCRPVQIVESIFDLLRRWERELVQSAENTILIAFVGHKGDLTTWVIEKPQKVRQQPGIAGYLRCDLHEHQQALGLVSICLLLCLGTRDLYRDGACAICGLSKSVGDKSQDGCRHHSGNTCCHGPSFPFRQASLAQPPAGN